MTNKVQFTSSQFVQIEFEYASIAQRVAAYIIDNVILAVYLFIAAMSLEFNDLFPSYGHYLFFSALLIKLPWILYQAVMEYLTGGQTVGKMILGIRVVQSSGERIGFRQVITRWFFRGDFLWISPGFFVLFIPTWNILDTIFTSLSAKNQRLGDVLAETIVVRNKSLNEYTFADILKIQSNESYVPTYPQVVVFTDEDMIYLKNCLQQLKKRPRQEIKQLCVEVADEAARLIGLEQTPPERQKFLETLLSDYVVLTR
jgi:uncharacterized RDD family membrane protein YckC